MVAAATTVAFGMNAQDASVETQAIGVVIDAHALLLVEANTKTSTPIFISLISPTNAYKIISYFALYTHF